MTTPVRPARLLKTLVRGLYDGAVSSRNLASSAAPAVFPWRRITLAVLVALGVLALASLAGTDWMVRAGLVLGLATGVVAAVLAVRALRRLDSEHREKHGEQIIALERDHGEQMRTDRARSTGVVETLSDHLKQRESNNAQLREHNAELTEQLGQAGEVIEAQRVSLEALHTENDELRSEIEVRDGIIGGLRQTLATREEELAGLLGDPDSAEVYAMPRRVRSAGHAVEPDENELVDLALLQTVTPKTDEVRRQA